MTYKKLHLYAFGGFRGKTFDLAPGLNIYYGPNESGKSTLQSGLYAGLCGIKRGTIGSRLDSDELRKKKPWSGSDWRAGAVIQLNDGREIELNHDLEARTGMIVDRGIGRELTAECLCEGAPDGAKLLELDRRSFLAICCVRQGDLLGLADPRNADQQAATIQQQLQLAASTAAKGTTAMKALGIIDDFVTENIGSERVGSGKPLPLARRTLEAKGRALAAARLAHEAYAEATAELEELRLCVEHWRREEKLARLGASLRTLDDVKRRLAEAKTLDERFAGQAPVDTVEGSDCLQDASIVLERWDKVKVPVLEGPTATELEAQLRLLPNAPSGDRTPSAEITRARDSFVAMSGELKASNESKPAEPVRPAVPEEATPEQIFGWVSKVVAEAPVVDPNLISRLDSFSDTEQGDAKWGQRRRLLAYAGTVLLIAGLALALALSPVFGGCLAALGGIGLVFSRLKVPPANEAALRAKADLAARIAQAYDRRAEVEAERLAAIKRVSELGLPSEPEALRTLAYELSRYAERRLAFDAWLAKNGDLRFKMEEAATSLRRLLVAAGTADCQDLGAMYDAYAQACTDRAAQSSKAAERPAVEQRILARQLLGRPGR